jgi:hypothetical protein
MGVALSTDESRVFIASHSSDAIAAFVRSRTTGLLTQGEGGKGCISETGANGCFDGRALDGVRDVDSIGDFVLWAADNAQAVGFAKKDSDSKNYVMSSKSSSCISEDGSNGCRDGHGLNSASSIEIGDGGTTVYVGGDSTIAFLTRDKFDGELEQSGGSTGCINDDGSDGCVNGYVPGLVTDILGTTNGKFVYAAASGNGDDGAVLVFARDTGSGELTEVGCVNDTGSNGCVDGNSIKNPTGVAADFNNAGGLTLYVAANGSDGIVALSRDKESGQLTQIQCWNETGSGGCLNGHHLTSPNRVNAYKTNKFVEVTSGDGVSNFARDKKTGLLVQLPGAAGCVTETGDGGSCFDGNGLTGATGIVSSGGGKHVYVTGTTADAVSGYKLK